MKKTITAIFTLVILFAATVSASAAETIATLPSDDGWKNILFICLMALFFILGCVAIIIRNERTLKPPKEKKKKVK